MREHDIRRLGLEPLEQRRLLAVGSQHVVEDVPTNLEGHLAALLREITSETGNTWNVASKREGPLSTRDSTADNLPFADLLRFDAQERVFVDIWTAGPASEVAGYLADIDFHLENVGDEHHLLEGSLPVTSLATAAVLPGVLSISPALRPITNVGEVTTQGDAIIQADQVRDSLGYDGTGVKIGVLSDSFGDPGDSIDNGDLPGTGNPYGNTTPVEVLRDFDGSGEGRAMLEIIHDIAPAADLAFHTAYYGQLDFANGIRALADVGCDVIVDDVLYFNEPWFQDGIIAQAIDDVTDQHGITYVTSAGNENGSVHGAPYRDADGWHDFDGGAAVDTELSVSVPPGADGLVVLQWSDPWYTIDGVTNDFDLYAYRQSDGAQVGAETTDNVATQQPLEWMLWSGGLTTLHTDIKIRRVAGSGDAELKLWVFTGTMNEHSGGPSILGHATAETAITVGAVPFHDPDVIEPFSSTGPVTIHFDPSGNPLPSPVSRQKPDLVAPDDVNTSFFGNDIPEDTDDDPNFRGTSAAAPHVAAVAALVLNAHPGLTPEQVRNVTSGSADPLGDPGWDGVYGAGRANALRAVQEAVIIRDTAGDTTGPVASMISPPAVTSRHVAFVRLQFDQPLAEATSVDPAHYELRGAGADRQFDTVDDVIYSVLADYDGTRHAVTIDVTAPVQDLPIDLYRVTLASTITDEAGNPLNGGADQTFHFEIAQWTGFFPVVPPEFDASGVPDVAVNDDGRAAVAWRYTYETPDGFRPKSIGLAVYDENGALIAGPTTVDDPYETASSPAVGMAPDGTIVVAHNRKLAPLVSNLFVSRFSADGLFLNTQRVVDSVGLNWDEDVAVFPNGEFAVTWLTGEGFPTPNRVRVRFYHADGTPKTEVLTVHDGERHGSPTVAGDADGNFVVAWSHNADSVLFSIFAQRYDHSGIPIGDPVMINTTTKGSQRTPDIAMKSTGECVVAWHSDTGEAIRFQRLSTDLSFLGNETIVAYEAGTPRVSMNERGDFLVGWSRTASYIRRYHADGTPVDAPFYVGESVLAPALGMDGEGSFLVAIQGPELQWYTAPVPDVPDLRASSLSVPDVAAIGHHLELTSIVFNHGVTGSPEFELQYFLSPDDEITGTGNDRALFSSPVNVDSMLGGTKQRDTSYTFVPGDLAAGTYWAGVVVDVNDAVPEEIEGNNVAVVQIELTDPPRATGPEFRANLTTAYEQMDAAVISAPDGSFIVLWSGNGPGDDEGVFMRRFSAGQVPLGPDERVNEATFDSQYSPSAGTDAEGNFTVAWVSRHLDGQGDIFARRYSADGTPLGGEFLVNTSADDCQDSPAVAVADDGSHVIAWISDGQTAPERDVFAQRYEADGTPVGGEFRVNSSADRHCARPTASYFPNDYLMVAWGYEDFRNEDNNDVRYEVFDEQGQPIGGEQIIQPPYDNTHFDNPSLAVNAQGDALMVWEGYNSDSWNWDVYGQWFSSTMTRVGGAFLVNSYRRNMERNAHAVSLRDDTFLATWEGSGWSYGQRFAIDRSMIGGEWRVSTEMETGQDKPFSAGIGGQGFVTVWTSDSGDDGSGTGIFAQVFDGPAPDVGDLVVTEIAELPGAYVDQTINVSATVANHGPSDVGALTCQYYLSVDRTINSDDIPFGTPFQLDGIPAWQEYRDSRSLTLPDRLGGVFYVGLVVDVDAAVIELDEGNNKGTSNQRGVIGPLPDAFGGELQLNETASGNQRFPTIARQPDGSYVVAWVGNGPEDSNGVFLRRFSGAGEPLTGEIRANTYTTGWQQDAAIAVDQSGNFVVVWASDGQDGSRWGIFAQRFLADGQRVGGEFPVNTTTNGSQYAPDVAMDVDGNFTVVWDYGGIWGRQFDANGQPLGDDTVLVEERPSDPNLGAPRMAMHSSGEFGVVWHVGQPPNDEYTAYVQLFGRDAIPATGRITVGRGQDPDVDMAATGDFVVVSRSGTSTTNRHILVRQFDADGTPVGPQLQASSNAVAAHEVPRVSAGSDGGFVVVWQSTGQDGDVTGIHGKRFDSDGTPKDGEFAVNTTRAGNQAWPDVAAGATDDFLVVWNSQNGDGDGYAICGQVVAGDSVGPLSAQDLPYSEGLESGDVGALPSWEFATAGSGAWDVTDENGPHAGGYHLRAYQSDSSVSAQEAILKLDLSDENGTSDLALGFWARQSGTITPSWLSFSEDGSPQSWVLSFRIEPAILDVYTHHTFDLARVLANAGISQDEDVYLKFHHDGAAANSTMTFDDILVWRPLRVEQLEPSASGFVARFNRPLDATKLSLYDVESGQFGSPDVSLVGVAIDDGRQVGPVQGSLVYRPQDNAVHFIKTGQPLERGVEYTVTLRSAPNGYVGTDGNPLDGDGDGLPGGDYQASFTVADDSGRVISIPDFCRGPSQEIDVPPVAVDDGDDNPGLPIRLNDASGVYAVVLTIGYDPHLLEIGGARPGPSAPAGATVVSDAPTAGEFTLRFTSPTPLPAGEQEFVTLSAAVPSGASYGSAQFLDVFAVDVNSGDIPATADDAIHVAAYFGDATGNGSYSGLDAQRTARVGVKLDSGFEGYPNVDPLIIADITRNGDITGFDAQRIAQVVVLLAPPEIPPLPATQRERVPTTSGPSRQTLDANVSAQSAKGALRNGSEITPPSSRLSLRERAFFRGAKDDIVFASFLNVSRDPPPAPHPALRNPLWPDEPLSRTTRRELDELFRSDRAADFDALFGAPELLPSVVDEYFASI